MKTTKLFVSAIIAAACLTSACGKDSKKKDPAPTAAVPTQPAPAPTPTPAPAFTLFHLISDDGICLEVAQEQVKEEGVDLSLIFDRGACPDQFNLEGAGPVTRYATCPTVDEDGTPMTAVFYNKMVGEDGVLDLTLLTPKKVCELANAE